MTSAPYIEFRHVTKRFDDLRALDDVTLGIPKGSFVTLLGPSGCGKTTLMRQLAGFSEPDGGDILIGGTRVNGLPPNKRGTPLVFQDYALFPHMTVFENIAYGLKLKKLPIRERREKVSGMLKVFNLEGTENRFPKQLSGGQQQRVAFARALVTGRDVLLLDEPLSNLDAKLRVEVRAELRQIQRRYGITTIYVTHDQDEALSMSDTIAVMRRGRIEQVGTPWEIYYRPANRFVADFVGTVNFLEAEIASISGGIAELRYCGGHIDVAAGNALSPGQAVTLAVRPECLSFAEAGGDGLAGDVVNVSFLGRATRYWVRAGGQTLVVDETDPKSFAPRSGRVALALDASKAHVLTEAGPND